ncbi:hypothetical protein CDD83_6471 [Cordyceps sp. RAO-2017]|nr:hypothetical protein CDD83_6471 [Cordyceps sp. RAO-2017]
MVPRLRRRPLHGTKLQRLPRRMEPPGQHHDLQAGEIGRWFWRATGPSNFLPEHGVGGETHRSFQLTDFYGNGEQTGANMEVMRPAAPVTRCSAATAAV